MIFNKRLTGAFFCSAAIAGALAAFGSLSAAAPLIRMQRYSVNVKKPPAAPGGTSTAPGRIKQSPDYTSTSATAAQPNNLRVKIQLENVGVRVDAYWRRLGTPAWNYYGAQTSQLYSTGIIAQFNPFYLPSGEHELKFKASGYADCIVPLSVPY